MVNNRQRIHEKKTTPTPLGHKLQMLAHKTGRNSSFEGDRSKESTTTTTTTRGTSRQHVAHTRATRPSNLHTNVAVWHLKMHSQSLERKRDHE
ncbi:uncharacterized protein LOC133843220 isoform X2 [Drosophila sulfurigaster albostrigata]|uniref:uncharacterized protein LOC133843220 isoform X2 n=1 Tax=Drosophila sulfurigaster albostrigata TaxID=89887 RepID=UPI002D21D591|nr:uncharacterized protein LOC133843220 isoform X2 [Drosophila sulfurigaster albostrigata]